jgi:hypothetical protein
MFLRIHALYLLYCLRQLFEARLSETLLQMLELRILGLQRSFEALQVVFNRLSRTCHRVCQSAFAGG